MATIREIIEAQANAADANTSVLDLYKIVNAAVKEGGPIALYDSAGVMPIDSDYVGSILSNVMGALYVLDSAGGSWNPDIGIEIAEPLPPFGGTISGYATSSVYIDKFSFTSDGNSTDVGNPTVSRFMVAGHSSTVSGYTTGGRAPPDYNIIEKFPFAVEGNATDVGDLTATIVIHAGHSDKAGGYGFTSGGYSLSGGTTNRIERFSFTTDGNATDFGDLTKIRERCAGQSSLTHGYNTGNWPPDASNHIDKFPFASGGLATLMGSLSQARYYTAGQSSPSHGYNTSNIIDKFSFASDGNATLVGNQSVGRTNGAGQSSVTYGYTSGGTGSSNVIDKFPFASDTNATDVGNLVVGRQDLAGQQY